MSYVEIWSGICEVNTTNGLQKHRVYGDKDIVVVRLTGIHSELSEDLPIDPPAREMARTSPFSGPSTTSIIRFLSSPTPADRNTDVPSAV